MQLANGVEYKVNERQGMNKKITVIFIACIILFCGSYLLGAYSYAKSLWPIEELRKLKKSLRPSPDVRGVTYGTELPSPRLTSFPDKKEIPCPAQTGKTMVLLLIGQSNTGNHAGQRYESDYGEKVINYFDNKCYVARSPLLGTSGEAGESWTLLGNKLINAGSVDRVILIPAGVGGSSISQWKKGGDLNGMLMSVLNDAKLHYQITQILWHQGETDFNFGTSEQDYKDMFYSLVDTVRGRGIEAPIYPSVATKCGINPKWSLNNQVAVAQKSLKNKEKMIFDGVNTDSMLGFLDRQEDCHFSATGQEKFANAWFDILKNKY